MNNILCCLYLLPSALQKYMKIDQALQYFPKWSTEKKKSLETLNISMNKMYFIFQWIKYFNEYFNE